MAKAKGKQKEADRGRGEERESGKKITAKKEEKHLRKKAAA